MQLVIIARQVRLLHTTWTAALVIPFLRSQFSRRGTNGPFGIMFLIFSNGPLVPLDHPDASVGSRRDMMPKGIMTAPTVSATAGNDGAIPPVHGGGNSPPDRRR